MWFKCTYNDVLSSLDVLLGLHKDDRKIAVHKSNEKKTIFEVLIWATTISIGGNSGKFFNLLEKTG